MHPLEVPFERVADISGLTESNLGEDSADETWRRILRVTLAWLALITVVLVNHCGYDGVRWVIEWLTSLGVRV